MYSPGSGLGRASIRPYKKLRVGTKSCVECRRRKVRCVYSSGEDICDGCSLHGTPCHSQKAQNASAADAALDPVTRRLEDLDWKLCALGDALGLDLGSAASGSSGSLHLSLDASGQDAASDLVHQHREVPLLNALRDARLVEHGEHDEPNCERNARQPLNRRTQALMRSLARSLPPSPLLVAILQQTESYWPIWQICAAVLEDGIPLPQDVASAESFLVRSMKSGRPIAMAIAVLWLSLCIQQLSIEFLKCQRPPATSWHGLLQSYIAGAEALVAEDADTSPTLGGVSCGLLLHRLYVDMGRPRKAWLSLRRSLTSAVLIGLDCVESEADQDSMTIWSSLWQQDRNMSVILGMPYAVAESHPSLSKEPADSDLLERGKRDIALISGHIIERNQQLAKDGYVMTAQMEQTLDILHQAVISPLEQASDDAQSSLGELFATQALRIYFYNAVKHVHLPYMIQSPTTERFSHNRSACLSACRELIDAYQALRQSDLAAFLVCDLMDFQVFSAGLLIAVDLLKQGGQYTPTASGDWNLISDLIKSLNLVAAERECRVAAQSSTLLHHLYLVGQGQYTGPEAYEAMIPYFGKMRLNTEPNTATTSSGSGTSPGMVDFDISLNHFDTTQAFFAGEEIAMDWTGSFDLLSDFDWTGGI